MSTNTETIDTCDVVLGGNDIIGLLLATEAGAISFVADALVLAWILRRAIRNWTNPRMRNWRLVQRPLDAYVLSLLVSDLVQAIGIVTSIKWIHERRVYCSSYCTFQGIMQTFGETTSALATIVIGVHTFLKIAFRFRLEDLRVARAVVAAIWSFVFIFAAIMNGIHNSRDPSRFDSHGNPDLFMVPTPYWCWMGNRFTAERIGGEYFWLWSAALTSIVLYLPLFFVLRGQLVIDPTACFRLRLRAREDTQEPYGKQSRMLLYPIAYTCLVLPLSVERWITFRRGHVISSATWVWGSLYELIGVVNVGLLFFTRRRINLLHQGGDDEYKTQTRSNLSSNSKFLPQDARWRVYPALETDSDAATSTIGAIQMQNYSSTE